MNHIHYKNKEIFQKTLQTLKSDGLDKLHILADFDRTLTKSFVNGEKKPSIISVLRDGNYLTPEYRKKAHELFDYYHQFEINQDISEEERNEKMLEWWSTHKQVLIDFGLKKLDIENSIYESNLQLRAGIKEFLLFLNTNNIPLVIMSASGIGNDAIELFLEKEGFLTKNIYIISNTLFWDKNGQAIGFDKRIIHSFNKGERVLKDYPKIYETVKEKRNVILLGDSLGDPNMIDGFDYDNCIKIGFLNEKEEELLEIYKEKYDVVLTGDDEGDFVNAILR